MICLLPFLPYIRLLLCSALSCAAPTQLQPCTVAPEPPAKPSVLTPLSHHLFFSNGSEGWGRICGSLLSAPSNDPMAGCEYNHQVLSISAPVICVSSFRNACELRPRRPILLLLPCSPCQAWSAAEERRCQNGSLWWDKSPPPRTPSEIQSPQGKKFPYDHLHTWVPLWSLLRPTQPNDFLPQTPGQMHCVSLPVLQAPPAHSALTHSRPARPWLWEQPVSLQMTLWQ